MQIGDLVRMTSNRTDAKKNSLGLIMKCFDVKPNKKVYSLFEVQLCSGGTWIKRFAEDMELVTR